MLRRHNNYIYRLCIIYNTYFASTARIKAILLQHQSSIKSMYRYATITHIKCDSKIIIATMVYYINFRVHITILMMMLPTRSIQIDYVGCHFTDCSNSYMHVRIYILFYVCVSILFFFILFLLISPSFHRLYDGADKNIRLFLAPCDCDAW